MSITCASEGIQMKQTLAGELNGKLCIAAHGRILCIYICNLRSLPREYMEDFTDST